MPSAFMPEVAVETVEVPVEFAVEVSTSVEVAVEVAFAVTQSAPAAIARARMEQMAGLDLEVS